MNDIELVYSDGKHSLFACEVSNTKDFKLYELFISEKYFLRRRELFRAGHVLWIKARTDGFSPHLYLVDAWFYRGEDL